MVSFWRFCERIIIVLGALACVFVYLGISPKDLLVMPFPHWLWLIGALILFAVGVGSSLRSLYLSKWAIQKAKADYDAERQVTEATQTQELETLRREIAVLKSQRNEVKLRELIEVKQLVPTDVESRSLVNIENAGTSFIGINKDTTFSDEGPYLAATAVIVTNSNSPLRNVTATATYYDHEGHQIGFAKCWWAGEHQDNTVFLTSGERRRLVLAVRKEAENDYFCSYVPYPYAPSMANFAPLHGYPLSIELQVWIDRKLQEFTLTLRTTPTFGEVTWMTNKAKSVRG